MAKADKKDEISELKEQLFFEPKNGYDLITAKEAAEADRYARAYIEFLNTSRTEREAVKNAIRLAENEGFTEYVPGMELKAGLKIYKNNRGKSLILAIIGSRSLAEGCIIEGAHVDSPRLDLKQIPLYEQDELAFFKTHYYGGIKKYQWVTIPLELHGIVALKSGETVDVVIGREKDEPKFVITDLLPHLAADQMKKTMSEGITGEGFDACEIGFDRSLIGGYGHDDRVCAFAELEAILEIENPGKTCVCILADKEEIGSMGVSGMQSEAFESFMEDLCESQGVRLRNCFENSFCISADVSAAFDPNYPEVAEKRNACMINYGLGVNKFTGARGKSGTSDASAEVVAYIRRIFAENNVVWQLGELGKVDQGGGGTIAQYMANRNIDTIDAGVPVLSMHAPFEVVSKFDCYMAYKGMLAAYRDN